MITVLFTKPLKWNPWSWALQVVEDTDESHCAILYKSSDFNRHMVLHSKLFNVHLVPYSDFYDSSYIVSAYRFECSDSSLSKALEAVSGDVGESYSYLQLPTMLFARLFGVESSFDDPGMTCTELVAKFLHSGIIDEAPQKQFCDYGLKDVRALVEKHGKLL